MGSEMADELERWIEAGGLWDAAGLDVIQARLAELGTLSADLVHVFGALRLRLEMGPVAPSMHRDVEAVVYPRLWKVIEAARLDLPTGEQLTRIQVLNRRLAQLFVLEDPPAPRRRKGASGE
jgi:hypothetical protein